MKIIAALALAILCASPALAAETITPQLSPNDCALLTKALLQLDGYNKIVHDQLGHDVSVLVPYDLGAVRLTVSHDETVLNAALADFRTAAKGLSQDDAMKLADEKQPVALLSIDPADLKVSVNPYPPSVLSALETLAPAKKP